MLRCALWFAAAMMLAGCTFLFDSERVQCSTATDCNGLEDGISFECGSKGYCEPIEGDCGRDADCDGELRCSTDNRCVECLEDSHCSEGLACGDDGSCRDPVWGCIDEPYGAPEAEPNFTVKMNVFDLVSDADVTSMATAEACSVNDFDCMTTAMPGSFTDRTLTLPFNEVGAGGFVGFVRISSPEFITGYFHILDPLVTNVVLQDNLRVFDEGTYDAIGAVAGVSGDRENTATLVILVYDCEGNPAPDVAMIPNDSPESVFFAIENEMTPAFQSTTTADGTAVLANVTTGLQDVVLRHQPPGGDSRELKRLSFFARAGAINYIHWYPTHEALMAAQARIAADQDGG